MFSSSKTSAFTPVVPVQTTGESRGRLFFSGKGNRKPFSSRSTSGMHRDCSTSQSSDGRASSSDMSVDSCRGRSGSDQQPFTMTGSKMTGLWGGMMKPQTHTGPTFNLTIFNNLLMK